MALQDYMVPISKCFVWVAYQKQWPWLPVAVADTAAELAVSIGLPVASIHSYVRKFEAGKFKHDHPLYARVYTGNVAGG